jgi:hypothetical protein
LLALDRGQRQKLPDQLFESFVNSIKTYAEKTREQPSPHDILDKLNQIHHLAKSSIAKDITLIKNAVNNTIQPSGRIATWAERVRSGGTPTHPPTPPTSIIAGSKEREIIVKLGNPESTALLRRKTPEELRRRINDTLKQLATSTDKIPQVVAAKQLKSGDISIHATNAAKANQLKDNSEAWVQILGTRARVLKPTYGVLVHGVRTEKENIDPSNQAEATEKIRTENATLNPGANDHLPSLDQPLRIQVEGPLIALQKLLPKVSWHTADHSPIFPLPGAGLYTDMSLNSKYDRLLWKYLQPPCANRRHRPRSPANQHS